VATDSLTGTGHTCIGELLILGCDEDATEPFKRPLRLGVLQETPPTPLRGRPWPRCRRRGSHHCLAQFETDSVRFAAARLTGVFRTEMDTNW
jgi:hypothetical protein